MTRPRLVPLVLLAASLAWAANYAFGAHIVQSLDPLTLTFWRWSGAACLLVPLALVIERPRLATIGRDWLRLITSGALGILGYSALLYQALQYLDPVDASLLSVLNPVLLAVTGLISLRERPSAALVVGLLVSLLGVVVVQTDGRLLELAAVPVNPGMLFMLLAAICWVLYSVATRRLHTPPLTATAAQAVITPLLLLPVVLSEHRPGPQTVEDWQGIVFLAVVPSVLAYGLWNIGTRRGAIATSGLYLTLIPVFTGVLSVIGGSALSASQLLGGLAVLLGVLLASPRPWRRPVQ